MTDHSRFIEDWAKQLGVANNAWAIVEAMVNTAKNFDTACALMTNLSWKDSAHRSYMERMSPELQKYVKENGVALSQNDLHAWLTWYITEIEELPQ